MASTFEGWVSAMVFSALFVIILGGVIFNGMNNIHSGNYTVGELDKHTSDIQTNFETYQSSQQEKIEGGDASFLSAVGLTLGTSWDILTSLLAMLMFFVAGAWITEVIGMFPYIPDIVGMMFRGLYITAIGFIILRVLFKSSV